MQLGIWAPALSRRPMLHADAGEGAGEDVPAGPADLQRLRQSPDAGVRACGASERLSLSMHVQSWPRLGLVPKPKI
eukprot:scaffold142650_cov32-Tisochrysis_lutea.AAC.9